MTTTDRPTPQRGLRKGLGYLNWLFNPFHGLDASRIYDLLATGSATQSGLYLNLGYWPNASTLDEASDALALLVGEAADMDGRDTVLDCGFGFGDQDLLWARTFAPHRIRSPESRPASHCASARTASTAVWTTC
jgi:hypothetical protein